MNTKYGCICFSWNDKIHESLKRFDKEGAMTIQAQIKWTDGLQFVARAGKGPAIVMDNTDC